MSAREQRRRGLRARATARLARLDLRDRVTLATAAVLAGGLALLSVGAMLLLSRQLDHDASSALDERADAHLAAIERVNDQTVVRHVPGDVLDEQAWVFDAGGRTLRRASARPEVERAARSLAGVARATEHDVGEEVRLRAEPAYAAPQGERIGTVVVGLPLGPYERTEHLAALVLGLLDLCIVAFGALLARRAVGAALRPVADMTARAAEWSEHDLDRRFELGPPRDELTALSATLDALLARIAASVRREQRFSAELAHELRTPLAGVRGEAELALRAPALAPDAREALEQILAATDRMQSVIDVLLTAARGEDGGGGTSDVAAGARAAVDAAAAAAERRGVGLTLSDAGEGTVAAEQQLVAQTLVPLLDNAIRHARGEVALRIQRDGGDMLLHVQDDGEGFAAEQVEQAFAPGVSSSGGAGLGLPLAQRLARSAGGEIQIRPSSGADDGTRGGHVVLRLPALS